MKGIAMKNIIEGIKNSVKKALHHEKPGEEEKRKESASTLENLNRSTVQPGLEDKKEDISRKVFEKTGHLHEGVGQSSTLEPQETPEKINHGIKDHAPQKK